MLSSLSQALAQFEADDDAFMGVIRGAGRAFCAGADVEETLPFIKEHGSRAIPPSLLSGRTVKKPLIAAIHGFCLGGGLELALACDIRIATENTKFSFPETGLGLIPGWGGTQRLVRLIGVGRASEMILTAKATDAKMALGWGLVNEVVPEAELDAAAGRWAEAIVKNPAPAVRAAKEALNCGLDLTLEQGLALEERLEREVMHTPEYGAAVEAYLEGRRKHKSNEPGEK